MSQDKLRRLLHSLTESEIKFFRQYARRHITKSKAIYLKLFDLMLSRKNDDDQLIRSKLGKKITSEGFVSLKKYLYELVLKTLVILREETSIHGEILKELGAAEVLTEKQLFQDAIKKLDKIQSATKNNELFCLALTAAWFQEIIMRTTGYTLTNSRETSERFENLTGLVGQIQSQFELSALFADYGNLNQSGLVKSEEEKKLLAIFNNPLLEDQLVYPLASAQRTYYIMNVLKARYLGNKELSLAYLEKIYSVVQEYPVTFPYHEYLLIFTHYMLVLSFMEKGDFKEASILLRKMKTMKALSNQNNYLLFRLTFSVELMMMKIQNRHDECLAIIMEYETRAKAIRGSSFNIMEYRNYQIIINYLMSRLFYTQAVPFINTILNDQTTKDRGVPFQVYARIMNLIVHFELKNFDLVESGIRSLDYFVKKNNVQFQFINKLLKFFRSITRSSGKFEDALNELGGALSTLTDVATERIHLYEVIESGWLQQKGLYITIPGPRPMFM